MIVEELEVSTGPVIYQGYLDNLIPSSRLKNNTAINFITDLAGNRLSSNVRVPDELYKYLKKYNFVEDDKAIFQAELAFKNVRFARFEELGKLGE